MKNLVFRFTLILASVALLASCELFGLGKKASLTKVWDEGYSGSPYLAIAAKNGYLYASAGTAGIRVYSLANAAKPSYIRTVVGQSNGYYDLDFFTKFTGSYLAASNKGCDEFSLAAPDNPVKSATTNGGTSTYKRIGTNGGMVAAAAGGVSYSSSPVCLYGASADWIASSISNNSFSNFGGYNSIDVAFVPSSSRLYAVCLTGSTGASVTMKKLRLLQVDATGADVSGYSIMYYNYLELDQYTDGATTGAIAASGTSVAAIAGYGGNGSIYSFTVEATSAGRPSITPRGQTAFSGAPLALAMSGNTAYALLGSSIAAYDVSGAPKLLSSTSCGSAEAIALYGDYVYIGSSSGLAVYSK